MAERSPTVRVKRDGPRGWHSIAAASYDPTRHQRVDDDAATDGEGELLPLDTNQPMPDIPDDWESLHWTQQVRLAEQLSGRDIESDEDQTKAQKADAIIRAALAAKTE